MIDVLSKLRTTAKKLLHELGRECHGVGGEALRGGALLDAELRPVSHGPEAREGGGEVPGRLHVDTGHVQQGTSPAGAAGRVHAGDDDPA